VYDRSARRAAVDDARDAHPDAEQQVRRDGRVAQDVGDGVADVADHPGDVVAVRRQRALGPGQLGQRQVEQLDAYAGLAHVDADEVRAAAVSLGLV
jgi:hypothetical protein